ncbi:hypothetical protein AGMMS49992_25040 [Clostridia bacterium]|nr:hypothetical protein AGMMS49992_25040 [Clostridia bacterium]
MKRAIQVCALLLVLLICLSGVSVADYNFPLETPIKLTLGLSQNNNVTDYDDNSYTKWLEEGTGIDIEFVLFPSSNADVQTKLNLMVASGDPLPDILTTGLTETNVYDWGRMGLILPMNDYFAKNEDFKSWCEDVMGVTTSYLLGPVTSLDGNIYSAPMYAQSYNDETWYRAFINRNWLETLGLDAPKTYDDFLNVLRAFRDNDPNGNGEADEIPMLSVSDLGWLQNMFIYYNNVGYYLPLNETDGAVDVAYDKPEYRDFLVAINSLVKENLLTPLSWTLDGTQTTALLQAEVSQVGLIVNGAADAFGSGRSADDYVAFEVPVGPNGAHNFTLRPTAVSYKGVVSSQCKYPQAAMDLLNIMFDKRFVESPLVARYGEKDVDWRYYDPEKDTDKVGAIPGFDPYIVQLQTQWGVPSNKLWQVHALTIVSPGTWWIAGVRPETDYNLPAFLYGANYGYNRKFAPNAEDLLVTSSFQYTEDEKLAWADMKVALSTYITETRAQFALGELDPTNDAVWQSYLNELGKLKYKEILELDNAANQRKQAALGN